MMVKVIERLAFYDPLTGFAFYPEDGENYSELMQAADRTMYEVKSQGKNSYQFSNKG